MHAQNEQQTAAPQEAVAYWRVTFRMYPENIDCCETFVRGPDRPTLDTLGISPRPVQIISTEPLYAAPVTAAPANDLHAHLLHMLGAKDHEDAGRIIGELHAAAMRTPAAPGIDLTSLVPAEREKPELMMATWHEVAGWNACVAEIRRRIDASPKGALNEQFGSAEGLDSHASMEAHYRQALERIASQGPHYGPDGTRETWQHWCEIARDALADSPKGGRDLIACVDRIEEAIEHRVPHDIYGTVHVELAEIRRLAQAGDAEVQP